MKFGDFWITNLTFTNMYFLVFYAFFYGLSDTYSEAAEIVNGAGVINTVKATTKKINEFSDNSKKLKEKHQDI